MSSFNLEALIDPMGPKRANVARFEFVPQGNTTPRRIRFSPHCNRRAMPEHFPCYYQNDEDACLQVLVRHLEKEYAAGNSTILLTSPDQILSHGYDNKGAYLIHWRNQP